MKVLLGCYWELPVAGGIATYTNALRSELLARGHEVDVVSRGCDWNEITLETADGTQTMDMRTLWPNVVPGLYGHFNQYSMPPAWIMEGEGTQYVFEIALLKMCALDQYDLIHAHDVHAARALSRLRRPHTPVVLTSHGLLAYEWIVEQRIPYDVSIEWRYSFLRERVGLESCDLVMVPSNWMRRQYIEVFGVSSKTVVTVPLGIDPSRWVSRTMPPIDVVPYLRGRPVVACVARLVPLKGIDVLLRAVALVREQVPDVCCLVVGDGPQAGELRIRATSLGIEHNVVFLGQRTDVPQILSSADVFVLPSLHEVTPLTIIEAQMAGKAVVCTDVGGVRDLVESGYTGLVVPPGDAPALSAAVLRLLEDVNFRRTLGKAAKQKALTDRTMAAHVESVLRLYERVISRFSS